MSRPTRADASGRAYLDLQNLARHQRRPTQNLLVMYVLERFLARLAASPHVDDFVLKGGMLLATWGARRATTDVDLLVQGLPVNQDEILAIIIDIASQTPPHEDGVTFLTETVTARTIREDDLYGGVRVTMQTQVAAARVKLQLDVSTGDPVTPAPQRISYPSLLRTHSPVSMLGYPLPVVLAEKLCTAIDLGSNNSRVRDYADIWTLTGRHHLTRAGLRAALEATATHRAVPLRPLSTAIGADYGASRSSTYTAYRRRLGPDAETLPTDWARLIAEVLAFADPLLAVTGVRYWDPATRRWSPNQG